LCKYTVLRSSPIPRQSIGNRSRGMQAVHRRVPRVGWSHNKILRNWQCQSPVQGPSAIPVCTFSFDFYLSYQNLRPYCLPSSIVGRGQSLSSTNSIVVPGH
jgi:hypothetical protein